MKIGFIGTGNMGAALARAAAAACADANFYFADFDRKKALSLAEELGGVCGENLELAEQCDFLFLGVKPNVLPSLLEQLAPVVLQRGKELTLVTMAAGIAIAGLKACLNDEVSVIRIMPNTPVSVGKGVIVYCSENTDADREKAFVSILARAGLVEKIEESKIDAASALHGCGPAFVYLFLEALSDGAVNCGLSRDAALRFAAATASGAAEMVLKTGQHPGALKDAVCSPGGTTIEGVRVLEEGGFRGNVMDAVVAAYEKTLLLGKKG